MLFSSSELGNPEILKQHTEWQEQRAQRERQEKERLRSGTRFDYEPHALAWCRAYTDPDDLVAAANLGGQEALARLEATGQAVMDPVSGHVAAVYAICARQNPLNSCDKHTPTEGAKRAAQAQPPGAEVDTPAAVQVGPVANVVAPELLTSAGSGAAPADDAREAAGPIKTKLRPDARIKVVGRVNVGTRMELTQAPAASQQGEFFVAGRSHDDLVAAVDDPFMESGMANAAQRMNWTFEDHVDKVDMVDDAFTTSFGIFGAPGSGKTRLMLYLFEQLLAEVHADDPNKRFGALILDPKAALIADMRAIAERTGRTDDLVILSVDALRGTPGVNVIDAQLEPHELANLLVLAAQSAGVSASEDFWFGTWRNVFAGALEVLAWMLNERLTLRNVVDAVLGTEPDPVGGAGREDAPRRRKLQAVAERARDRLPELDEDRRADMELAIEAVESFYRQEAESVETVDQIITQAYGVFRRSKYRCFSPSEPSAGARHTPFYDQIIDEGKIVMVSLPPSEPAMARTLCTLIKCLFQKTILSRLSRVGDPLDPLLNFERPIALVCDEYSEVASELPGQSMGDGQFFGLARQMGCMGLLATQSVHMLKNSSLKDHWEAIFSNFAAKVFMPLGDKDTAEQAMELVGETDWYLSSATTNRDRDGFSSGQQRDMRERKELPTHILTQVLGRGQAVVIGSLDGNQSRGTHFVRVPHYGEHGVRRNP